MNVKQALPLLDIEYRQILTDLIIREGVDVEMSTTACMRLLCGKSGNELSKPELVAVVALGGIEGKINRAKFAPKLDFRQRCEVLALHGMGYSRDLLAKVYDINRRTVAHIKNGTSVHYKAVREERLRLGEECFRQVYATPEVITNIAKAQAMGEEKTNNKFANTKAGTHLVQGPMCKYKHRVSIAWVEAGTQNVEVAGWYYRDLDGDMPNAWFTVGGPENLRTSHAAYKVMLDDISDPLE